MREELLRLISETINVDLNTLQESINDEAIWDSLLKVEVIFEIEDRFNIVFSEEELAELKTPEQFIEAVIAKEN